MFGAWADLQPLVAYATKGCLAKAGARWVQQNGKAPPADTGQRRKQSFQDKCVPKLEVGNEGMKCALASESRLSAVRSACRLKPGLRTKTMPAAQNKHAAQH